MNNKEKKELTYCPSTGLDAAVNEKFGPETQCDTSFSIITMRHHTTYRAKGPKRKQIQAFIEGFMAGNKELGNRLTDLPLKKVEVDVEA